MSSEFNQLGGVLTPDQLAAYEKGSGNTVIGQISEPGEYARVIIRCPACKGPRYADFRCGHCQYTSLFRAYQEIRSQLKQISGLADQTILTLDKL